MFIKIIIAYLVVCLCSLSHGSQNITLNGHFMASGQSVELSIVGEIDVYDHIYPHCAIFKTEEYCFEAMDAISWHLYGLAFYTPRHKTRTLTDSMSSRGTVLGTLLETYQYQDYLEIGCDYDSVFSSMKPLVTTAIGVDPVRGGTHRMTSDDFFHQNNQRFDLVFVDGLHTAEQTIRDIENSLKILNPGGSIVVHDCNPRFAYRQFNTSDINNGDVWKVVALLRYADDLEVVTVDVDHGVAVIQKRANRHPLPESILLKYKEHSGNILHALDYQDLELHREQLLRLVSIAELKQWLSE